jgi:gas vesicle protein
MTHNNETNGSNGPSFLSGLMFGGLIGATLGLLLAPQSGDKTRTSL